MSCNIILLNYRRLHPHFIKVVENSGPLLRTHPLTTTENERLYQDSTGFVPVLISSMHDGPGLSKPRLTSNSSLQLIGKINDSCRIAIITY